MPSLVAATALFCLSGVTVSGGSLGNSHRGAAATGQAGTASSASTSPSPAAKSGEASQPDPALAEAKSLFEGGKFSEAEVSARQFLESHADSADGHFLLGHILFGELHEKYVEAEETEGEGFEYKGSNAGGDLGKQRDAKARESLAEFEAGAKSGGTPSAADLKTAAFDYVLLKDNFLAAKYLGLALKLDPKDAEGWFYLARILHSQDQFAAAIQAFEQCLKIQPKNVLAEASVGLSYEGLKQTDEAAQAYQTAIAWDAQGDAKSPKPFIYLGRLYLSENQPSKAVPYLQQGTVEFPTVPPIHEELGRAYSSLNQLPEAQMELETAVSLEPDVASVHFLLGQVYRKRGIMDKAKIEFDKAEELNGTHSSDGRQLGPQ